MNPEELTPPHLRDDGHDLAADVIRGKLNAIYAKEPDAEEELAEVEHKPKRELSKHQEFMRRLRKTTDDMVAIQTGWHQYYESLSPKEKHEVWEEFYEEHNRAKDEPKNSVVKQPAVTVQPKPEPETKQQTATKAEIITRVKAQAALRRKQHLKALGFGLGSGLITIFILMFSFFNERFIAPFIQPSKNVSATPIIVDPTNLGPVGPDPKIIIPKINVEAPVVYDVKSIAEKDVQAGLERGVLHYGNTPMPGQKGNSVIIGHSTGNILNRGDFKFAFILLKSLEKDDTFIIHKDGKQYVYKVYNKFVTSPQDVSVLGPNGRTASMTLITCDPPGSSANRLIIQADQIFPDPEANTEAPKQSNTQPQVVPGNSKSLWQRLFGD